MHTSFWEKDVMLSAEFVVIGSGIIGLQTALELRDQRPHDRIIVLERNVLPTGASSRNAGFACFGSLTEILSDIDHLGESAAFSLVEQRWRGLQRLRARFSDAAIGYEAFGGFELLLPEHMNALDRINEVNRLLHPLFGSAVFSNDNASLRNSGFGKHVQALVKNPFEAQIHSGLLMRSLAVLAAENGIEIFTGAHVSAIDDANGGVQVHISGNRNLVFRAGHVAVCTNGFTQALLPDIGIVPARGQIIVTSPIEDLPWRGTYHLDEGFFYFRNIGNRILFGGGRNRDFITEETTDMAITDTIQNTLEHLLQHTIAPDHQYKIEHRWSGIMGFSADKQAIIQHASDHIVIGFGCNGMGVALGADVAARTAALLLQI